jgi:uncharacterized membrane protein
MALMFLQIMPLRNSSNAFLLRSSSVLPLFDSVFGVAITLLAFSVPDHVMSQMDIQDFALAVAIYFLSGITVVIYWFKLRKLVQIARILLLPQIVIGVACILLIVLIPKFVALVVLYGDGSGDLFRWTPSQVVNTIFLCALFLFDLLCLCFAFSLAFHPHTREGELRRIRSALGVQLVGFMALFSLGILELVLESFNNEYVIIAPLILIVEELVTVLRLSRL